MSATRGSKATLVHSLATLLRNNGDSVLEGSSTLTLQVGCVQHLTHLFEQYLLNHTHQHGFLALPSHPADTASLLQLQFIFDMLQKTLSLKLKRVPPRCLEGLRGVYSQLEVFTCWKSLTNLKELLSHCGGDLSSALPWLELHTLNFSYNSVSSLDESLSLLNVLKSLDLSHNRIQDCAEFLLPLEELQHLNLSYNSLQRAPLLGHDCRAKLVTLALRNNKLESINGVEQLPALQNLDLAYNLLMEHPKLASLSLLHNLQTLNLEGNPLYFLNTHRTSTGYHLSPRAVAQGLRLDGVEFSVTDLMAIPKQKMGQTCQAAVATAPEQLVQDLSSGGGDLSDSLSVSESGASRIRSRRSRVKVRTASISEPSDTDREPRQTALQDIVLHHQKDIERMDSFREQMGEDWLRFQHQLDNGLDPAPEPTTRGERSMSQVAANSCHGLFAPEHNSAALLARPDALPAPLLSSETKGEEELVSSEQLDTESTLLWSGHSPPSTESTLETSLSETQTSGKACAPAAPPEEEEEDLGVDLCRPMLVQVLSEDNAPPLFLRVRQGHVQEVDVHQGRVRTRLELACLRHVAVSEVTRVDKEKERSYPALELHFSYISRSRQKRQYLMLDDDPQQDVQALAELLSRVVAENERHAAAGKGKRMRLQCLKCRAEFPHPDAALSVLPRDEAEWEGTGPCPGDVIYCPECNSDHVIQLADQTAPSTSTPVYCDAGHNSNRRFNFDAADTPIRPPLPVKNMDTALLSGDSPLRVTQEEFSTVLEGATDTFVTAHSSLSNLTTNQSEVWSDQPVGSYAADGQAHGGPEGTEAELDGGGGGFLELQNPPPSQHAQASSHAFDLLSEDFEAVDHRLKLFLDVEVFEGDEEIHCFLKMSVVKFRDPREFPSLMVVSDQHIYILEMTSESEGQPSDWLRMRAKHGLCELTYLEVGLGSQTIHMEFDEGGAAYTLLVRDSARCQRFYSRLTGITRELAPKSNSKLKSISTTRLNPRHHLWPLVCEGSEISAEGVSHPPFLYLLAFLKRDDCLTSVTVLATRETLYLLDEDHQWSKKQCELPANEESQINSTRVTVRESQPISCVSSIHLSSSDPRQVDIKLYDEMAKEERTWSLRTEAGQEIETLVTWVRSQWEAMFGVKLLTAVQ